MMEPISHFPQNFVWLFGAKIAKNKLHENFWPRKFVLLGIFSFKQDFEMALYKYKIFELKDLISFSSCTALYKAVLKLLYAVSRY